MGKLYDYFFTSGHNLNRILTLREQKQNEVMKAYEKTQKKSTVNVEYFVL